MKLLYQTHSPYARKVLVMAHEVGIADRLEVIHQETSPTVRNDAVFALNPLGKVPVLVISDVDCLFDSTVICEYLDGLHAELARVPRPAVVRRPPSSAGGVVRGVQPPAVDGTDAAGRPDARSVTRRATARRSRPAGGS